MRLPYQSYMLHRFQDKTRKLITSMPQSASHQGQHWLCNSAHFFVWSFTVCQNYLMLYAGKTEMTMEWQQEVGGLDVGAI